MSSAVAISTTIGASARLKVSTRSRCRPQKLATFDEAHLAVSLVVLVFEVTDRHAGFEQSVCDLTRWSGCSCDLGTYVAGGFAAQKRLFVGGGGELPARGSALSVGVGATAFARFNTVF